MVYSLTIHELEDGRYSVVFKKSIYTADDDYQKFKIETKIFDSFDHALDCFCIFSNKLEIPFS